MFQNKNSAEERKRFKHKAHKANKKKTQVSKTNAFIICNFSIIFILFSNHEAKAGTELRHSMRIIIFMKHKKSEWSINDARGIYFNYNLSMYIIFNNINGNEFSIDRKSHIFRYKIDEHFTMHLSVSAALTFAPFWLDDVHYLKHQTNAQIDCVSVSPT